jgi:hypothetical protein
MRIFLRKGRTLNVAPPYFWGGPLQAPRHSSRGARSGAERAALPSHRPIPWPSRQRSEFWSAWRVPRFGMLGATNAPWCGHLLVPTPAGPGLAVFPRSK